MLETKIVEKVKTHMLCSIIFFFEKSYLLRYDMEKYGRTRHTTDGDIMRRTKAAR
jgi:hypothetical protein